MSIYCQARLPGETVVTFDDIISPGDVVEGRPDEHFVVGPDLGDRYPRLMPMSREHYMEWWEKINPHVKLDQRVWDTARERDPQTAPDSRRTVVGFTACWQA